MSLEPPSTPAEPDPHRIATPQDFGRELTAAKNRANLTIRQIARASGVPVSTVHDYLRGSHLPMASHVEPVLKVLSVVGEEGHRHPLWLEALDRARGVPARRDSAPYRGLATYQTADAPWFFGREALTGLVVERLVGPGAAASLPLMIVGASGSGKSSLLRAGVIPALRGAGYAIALVTPEDTTAAELRASRETQDGEPVAVVVDQFEEIFAADVPESERAAFIEALFTAPGGERRGSGPMIAVGMRADFYAHALRYPRLAAAIQDNQVVMGPMTADELNRAIVEPARKNGTDVEPALVDVLLRDLSPTVGFTPAAHDVGALPLLSHALLATWERSRGRRLTVEGYLGSGGIRDAIARSAEATFEALSPSAQDATRRLLLRLVRVSPDAPDTRRVVSLAAVRRDGLAAADLEDIADRFVGQRLLTADGDDVMLTHEALITAWPRLQSWLTADREGLLAWRRIAEAAERWDESGRDPHELLRGGRLAVAREWAAEPEHEADLNPLETAFLGASAGREKAEQNIERRRTRRLRRLVGALTVLVLTAGALAGYAQNQREAATDATYVATSRATAVRADELRGEDTAAAAQLSVAAYAMSDNADTRASLIESTGTPSATRLLGFKGIVESVALQAREHLLAAASADGTARLWDVSDPARPRELGAALPRPAATASLFAVALSQRAPLLAVGGGNPRTDGVAELWSLAQSSRPRLTAKLSLGSDDTVYTVAFAPVLPELAVGSADGTVRLWDISEPRTPRLLTSRTGSDGPVQSLQFDPTGRMLAAGKKNGDVDVWQLTGTGEPQAPPVVLKGPTKMVFGVAFSADGSVLAAGSRDGTVWLWDVSQSGAIKQLGAPIHDATSWVDSVAFSPDSRTLAVGSSDDNVKLWSISSRTVVATLPHPGPVASLAWLGDSALVTGAADYVTRVWSLPTPVLPGDGVVNTIAFSPDGKAMAVGSDTLQLWNPVTRQPEGGPVSGPGMAETAAFSPDGRYLAVGYSNGVLRIWRVDDEDGLGPIVTTQPVGQNSYIESVAFGPGDRLATGSDDGVVRLWTIAADGTVTQKPIQPSFAGAVYSVAFSQRGGLLAAGSEDDTARVWKIDGGGDAVSAGKAITGSTNYVYAVAFNPAGTLLAIGSADRTVRLEGVSEPTSPALLAVLTGPANYVYALAFSPDGRTLAAGSTDETVWLWQVDDPRAPELTASLTGPTGHVYSVAISPDGATLAAGGADAATHLWTIEPKRAVAAVCADAGDPITRAEWDRYVPGMAYRQPCPDA